MSAPTVNEAVLAEWTDANGHARTLGSLTPCHKRDAGFMLKVTTDEKERVWTYLTLEVAVKTAGKERRRELSLVIPPHSLRYLVFEELEVSQIRTPATFSAVGDARLFDSGRVIRANFALAASGHVLMPKSTAKKITPASQTSSDLLRGLQSLSRAQSFSVYMRPSDYARQGLNLVCDRNRTASHPATPFTVEDLLDGRNAEVNWPLFGIVPDPVPDNPDPPSLAPPPYLFGPTPPPPNSETLVSCTPPITGPIHISSDNGTPAVSETDLEQISLVDEPHADGALDRTRDKKRPLSPSLNHNPNYACRHIFSSSPQRQQQHRHSRGNSSSPIRADLILNLNAWIETALATNARVYEHPRLQRHLHACATAAQHADVDDFLDARAVLAAEFFYDPDGADKAGSEEQDEGRTEKGVGRALFVADMEKLLRWALRLNWRADVDGFSMFTYLGRSARDAVRDDCTGALGNDGDEMAALRNKEYRSQKALCINCVLLSCVRSGRPA